MILNERFFLFDQITRSLMLTPGLEASEADPRFTS